MKFDWYQASLSQPVDEVLPAVLDAYGPFASHRMSRAMHGFGSGVEVHTRDVVNARIWWGGFMPHGCHVQVTGSNAPAGVHALRKYFPCHRVSRADAAEDFTADDAWDRLSEVCTQVCKSHRVKIKHEGDFEYLEDGRTLYFGSSSSVTSALLYEKGKQLSADPRWVRLEVRCRPKSSHKEAVSVFEPAAIFGTAKWTKEIADRLTIPEVERMRMVEPWQPTDDANSVKWMLRQYGRVLTKQSVVLGGWENVGIYLRDQLKLMAEEDLCVKNIARKR